MGQIQKRKTNFLQIIIFALQRAAGPYRGAMSGPFKSSALTKETPGPLPRGFRPESNLAVARYTNALFQRICARLGRAAVDRASVRR